MLGKLQVKKQIPLLNHLPLNLLETEEIIYLDNNATTPIDPFVLEKMLPFLTNRYGNAASSHKFGLSLKREVDTARIRIAELINSSEDDLIFTSGATESINLAIKGFAMANSEKGKHIVTVQTEHSAVLDTCKYLETVGFEITYLNVQKNGELSLEELKNALRFDTILVCVMMVNNETGTIQPIKEVSAICSLNNVVFFTDATQAVGKMEIDVVDLKIDLMAFSAHKIYGPKGIGSLFVNGQKKRKIKILSQIHGGGHEYGLRSGTLNVAGIVGFGVACEVAKKEMINDSVRILGMRNKLENDLLTIPGTFVNGIESNRLYNVTNICFQSIDASVVIGKMKNIAVSNGSACTSSVIEPSHVLKAMGLDDDSAMGSIRFSLGRFNTENDVQIAIQTIRSYTNKAPLNYA